MYLKVFCTSKTPSKKKATEKYISMQMEIEIFNNVSKRAYKTKQQEIE